VVTLGEIVMIYDLQRQGLSVSAIARRVGVDRKTVRKYLERDLAAPAYGPRGPRPGKVEPFSDYLRQRVAAFPELSAKRLLREIRDLGYSGGYSILTDFLRDVRPPRRAVFERRFETPPGRQAQVDFAEFRVVFTDDPEVTRIVCVKKVLEPGPVPDPQIGRLDSGQQTYHAILPAWTTSPRECLGAAAACPRNGYAASRSIHAVSPPSLPSPSPPLITRLDLASQRASSNGGRVARPRRMLPASTEPDPQLLH